MRLAKDQRSRSHRKEKERNERHKRQETKSVRSDGRGIFEYGMQCLHRQICLARLVWAIPREKRLEYNSCNRLAFDWHLPPAYTCQYASIAPRTVRYDMVGNSGQQQLAQAEIEGLLLHPGIAMHSSSSCSSSSWPMIRPFEYHHSPSYAGRG